MTNFYLHICENGHLKTDFKRVRPGDTCSVCGAKMIDSCPECGELIKKWYYYGSLPRGLKPNAQRAKAERFDETGKVQSVRR